MKTIKYSLIVLFNLSSCFVFSQGEYIVEIDRTNGNYNKIGSAIPGVTYVYPNVRAYSELDGMFIFQGGVLAPDHLFSIDITSAAVISSPLLTNCNCSGFKFDNSTGILYGLFFDSALSQYFLETINASTGTHAKVSTNPIPNIPICQGSTAFDEINHKYIIGGNTLYSVDANTGIIISNPTLSLLSGEVFLCSSISYDNSTGMLYGILWDANITNKYFLVSINSTTGGVTKIGPGSTLLEQGGSSAIDQINGQFIYLFSNSSGFRLATIDIATGNVAYNVLIAPLTANDNFVSLEYDNTQNKLYSIHWETPTITKISGHGYVDNTLSIYPNPFTQKAIIEFQNPKKEKCTLTLFDNQGRLVQVLNEITSDTIELERKNLTNGIYFFQLRTDKQVITSGKLAIE